MDKTNKKSITAYKAKVLDFIEQMFKEVVKKALSFI